MTTRLVAGCMTGTSMDALDAALVEIDGRGLTMLVRTRRFVSRPLGVLAGTLRRIAEQTPMPAGRIAEAADALAREHIEALRELLADERADLIAVHGQTVHHAPPLSWQLISPAPIAHALQTPVVYDLRAADLAAGGQGAPITPLADWILLRAARESRAVVNLGGFANYTWLPAAGAGGSGDAGAAAGGQIAAIRGGDICVCNQLLDLIARQLWGEPYDREGQRALRGQELPELRGALVAMLHTQAASGRSLGTGDEQTAWVRAVLERQFGADDIAASACAALGRTIAERVGGVDRVLLAGGGARNLALVRAIERNCGAPAALTDSAGVPAEQREAIAMAVLGALCQDGVAITLPQITQAAEAAPIAGCWIWSCGLDQTAAGRARPERAR